MKISRIPKKYRNVILEEIKHGCMTLSTHINQAIDDSENWIEAKDMAIGFCEEVASEAQAVRDSLKNDGKKYVFVEYTNRSGEYEFTSHVILIAKSKRKKDENLIHEYFVKFYGDSSECCDECEKASKYLYNGGEVGVKINRYNEITLSEYEVLLKLNIG